MPRPRVAGGRRIWDIKELDLALLAKLVGNFEGAIVAPAMVLEPDGAEVAGQLLITDNLQKCPPISAVEIDVVERFFGDILDAVLSNHRA
jgi:hypothetical protein